MPAAKAGEAEGESTAAEGGERTNTEGRKTPRESGNARGNNRKEGKKSSRAQVRRGQNGEELRLRQGPPFRCSLGPGGRGSRSRWSVQRGGQGVHPARWHGPKRTSRGREVQREPGRGHGSDFVERRLDSGPGHVSLGDVRLGPTGFTGRVVRKGPKARVSKSGYGNGRSQGKGGLNGDRWRRRGRTAGTGGRRLGQRCGGGWTRWRGHLVA